jgi:hypothetical protein
VANGTRLHGDLRRVMVMQCRVARWSSRRPHDRKQESCLQLATLMKNNRDSFRAAHGSHLVVAIAMALSLTLIPGRLQAQTPRVCPPTDATAAMLGELGAAILSDTTRGYAGFRRKYGIPAGTSADVVRVTDAAVCEAATAAIEARGAPHQSEAFVVVRLGATNPFYLAAPRVTVAPPDGVFFLNSQFKLITTFR